jgi:hypothetical protein
MVDVNFRALAKVVNEKIGTKLRDKETFFKTNNVEVWLAAQDAIDNMPDLVRSCSKSVTISPEGLQAVKCGSRFVTLFSHGHGIEGEVVELRSSKGSVFRHVVDVRGGVASLASVFYSEKGL